MRERVVRWIDHPALGTALLAIRERIEARFSVAARPRTPEEAQIEREALESFPALFKDDPETEAYYRERPRPRRYVPGW